MKDKKIIPLGEYFRAANECLEWLRRTEATNSQDHESFCPHTVLS